MEIMHRHCDRNDKKGYRSTLEELLYRSHKRTKSHTILDTIQSWPLLKAVPENNVIPCIVLNWSLLSWRSTSVSFISAFSFYLVYALLFSSLPIVVSGVSHYLDTVGVSMAPPFGIL